MAVLFLWRGAGFVLPKHLPGSWGRRKPLALHVPLVGQRFPGTVPGYRISLSYFFKTRFACLTYK